jgi:tetratricopeptide (TPR) repeat protein
LWERLGNRTEAGAVQRMMGRLYWEQGERAISMQYYHRALSILEGEAENIELAKAVSSISQMHMLASEYDAAIAWGERALALAKQLDAQEVVVHASNNIGVALTNLSSFEQGLALLRESLQQALALNLPHDAARAYVNLGVALTWHGQYAEAETIFDKLLTYATQAGTAVFQGTARAFLTKLNWWQGRWAAAMHHCQELTKWHDEIRGAIMSKVWASTLLGSIYNDLGQPRLARHELEGELNTARSLDEAQTTVPHLGELARSMALLGHEEEAAALIHGLLTLLKRTHSNHANSIPPLLSAFRWSAQNRAKPELLEAASDCLYYLEQIETQLHSQESHAALAEAQGIEALWNKKTAAAIEQFQQAATDWGNLNRPYDQGRVLNLLGQTLLQKEDSRQAQLVFDHAQSIIERLAAQLEDAELRTSFLNSVMVQEIQTGRSHAAVHS